MRVAGKLFLIVDRIDRFVNAIKVVALRSAVLGFFAVGLIVAFTLPPFQAPDEGTHWSAAFYRFESVFGGLRGAESCGPAHGLPEHMGLSLVAMKPEQRMPTARFSSLRRVPMVCRGDDVPYGGLLSYPGVVLARLLISNEEKKAQRGLAVFYLARILHGALVGLLLARLVGLMIRESRLPIGASILILVPLSPIFIQQSFAVSADPICFAFILSLLTLSLCGEKVSVFEKWLCLTLALIACYTKPVLVTLLPLAILATIRPMASPAERRVVYGIAAAAIVGSLLIVASYLKPTRVKPAAASTISPAEQLRYIAANPTRAITLLHQSAVGSLGVTPLVQRMGWLDTKVSKRGRQYAWSAFVFCAALELWGIIGALLRSTPLRLRKAGALTFTVGCSVFYLSLLAAPLVLYLTWTAVGAPHVAGMQPRYHLTTLLMLPALFFPLSNGTPTHVATLGKTFTHPLYGAVGAILIFYLIEIYISLAARYW